MRDSFNNPDKKYILIIEEINRGNAPAIFGETFQLLDRKVKPDKDNGYPVGTSEYGITNADISTFIYGKPDHEIRIPSNLLIIGTMNTSDQNVFTLDTAFQRRWNMRLVENSFANVSIEFANAPILDTGVSWKEFCTVVNRIIVENGFRVATTEDKRLGPYFVLPEDLRYDNTLENLSTDEYDKLLKKESSDKLDSNEETRLGNIRKAIIQNRKFPEKVIKYLWDDAFKFNRDVLFETSNKTLEDIIRIFMNATGFDRFKIFKEEIINLFKNENRKQS